MAAAAAAAVGLGTGLAAHSAGQAAEKVSHDEREEKAAQGRLILAVRTPTQERVDQVSAILRDAGATSVDAVTRTDAALTAGVSSASWTGA